MKIYIAGRMTGVKDYNKDQFNKIEKELKKQGYRVVNPIKLSYKLAKKLGESIDNIERKYYIKNDIKELLKCDGIYMMKDWMFSEGATMEYMIARNIGLKIIFGD